MKSVAIIVLTVVSISFVTAAILFSASGSEESEIANTEKGEKKSCCSDEMESSEVSENSVYQVNSLWKNQDGETVSIKNYKGENVVLSMIFTNCTYACPVIINDMRKIESGLTKSELENTKFLLVSMDSDRDTPDVLKEFSKKQNLDIKRWELLTGTAGNVRELSALFGFKYKKDEKGDFSHSNLINILDRNGEITYQHEGLNKDVTGIIEKIKAMN